MFVIIACSGQLSVHFYVLLCLFVVRLTVCMFQCYMSEYMMMMMIGCCVWADSVLDSTDCAACKLMYVAVTGVAHVDTRDTDDEVFRDYPRPGTQGQ